MADLTDEEIAGLRRWAEGNLGGNSDYGNAELILRALNELELLRAEDDDAPAPRARVVLQPVVVPAATPYGRMAAIHGGECTLSGLKRAAQELDRIWSTMTDEQKAAEPLVMKHHFDELKAKGLAPR
jgi:hypothetical protein